MKSKFLFLIILAALIIRLIPTLVTNQPFSTDTWPLIRLSKVLLTNPECKVWNDSVLGGYHNRWPAVILESVLFATITSLDPAYFFRFAGVIITQTSISATTYALIKRYRGTYVALLCTLALTSIPSFVVFTSSTLKEVYAYPLILLLALVTIEDSLSKLSALTFLIALTSVSSHPLAPLMMIAFLGSYLFMNWVKRLEGSSYLRSVRKYLFIFLILCSVYVTYMVFYGWEGLIFKFGLSDFLTIFTVVVAVYGWYVLVGRGFKSLLILTPGIMILVLNSGFLEVPSILPILLYVAPFIALFLTYIYKREGRSGEGVLESILLPVSVGVQYIAITLPLFLSVLHRLLNYLSFAFVVFISSLNTRLEKAKRYAVFMIILSLITSMLISINLTFRGDPITYYWRYGDREVVGVSNLIKYVGSEKVCGDAKIKYLIGDVIAVDSLCALRLYKTSSGYPTVFYSDNFRFGYVLSPTDIYLTQELSALTLTRDFVYSNGAVYVVR